MSEGVPFDKGSAEREKEVLVVEIGAGRIPFARGVVGLVPEYGEFFRRHPNLKYIAADIFPPDSSHEKMYTGSSVEAQFAPNQLSYTQIPEDGRLPFKDAAVSEVIMQNFLGAGHVPLDERENALREAARVLRPRGILKIIETVTPGEATSPGGPTEFIGKMMPDIFEKVESGDQQIAEIESLDEQYLQKLSRHGSEFILRFRKKANMIPTSRLGTPNELEK